MVASIAFLKKPKDLSFQNGWWRVTPENCGIQQKICCSSAEEENTTSHHEKLVDCEGERRAMF